LDASYGHILVNKGQSNGKVLWEMAEPSVTGISLKSELKEMKMIRMAGNEYLFILQNDERPLLLRHNLN
jgi:hypothetical protein